MYNLTYLGHRVTLPRLDLRSNFDLDLSWSNYTWVDAPWRDKHEGIKIVALPLKLKILSSKNRFGKFFEFWPLVTPILIWAKKWPKWFRNDFSRAFERRFPFCSTMRRSRDRRGGGGVQRLPGQNIESQKYRKQYIERQNIEVAKHRMRKISMGQNIEIAKYRIAKYRIAKYRKCKISKCKISKAAKYRKAKYRKQNIDVAKYRSGKISKDKISKWQNIERQNIEVAKYRIQNIEVAKYRT